jgi:Uma2 family endonuclease
VKIADPQIVAACWAGGLRADRQAPPEWEAVYEVAFRVRADGRVPDLAVVRADVDVRPGHAAYAPTDFGLLVEIVSPTSTGMDRVLKPAEYAAAGVPFYWRVETESAVEVIAYELVDGGYRETGWLSEGAGALAAPYAVAIDVTALSTP